MGPVLTIPKRLTHGEELVVVRRDEYEELLRQSQEAAEVAKVITAGEKAYRQGRTIKARSLKEAWKIYAKRPG